MLSMFLLMGWAPENELGGVQVRWVARAEELPSARVGEPIEPCPADDRRLVLEVEDDVTLQQLIEAIDEARAAGCRDVAVTPALAAQSPGT